MLNISTITSEKYHYGLSKEDRESHDGADDEQHKLLNIQQERRWTQVDILKKIFCRISLRSKRRKAIVTSWAVIGVTEIAGIT